MDVLVNQKEFPILDQRDGKIKVNVLSDLHYALSNKIQKNFVLDSNRVQKCNEISEEISNSTRNNHTRDSSICNPAATLVFHYVFVTVAL